MSCQPPRGNDADGAPCRGRGRPRDPEIEDRILNVALRQLAADGYGRMSLDAVAAEAGVSKPTIYRRWTSKADLATAALRTVQLAEPVVNTGATVGDLAGVLRNFRKSLLRPNGLSLLGTVLAEEHHTPELLQLFRERIVAPRRLMLRRILEQARERGELRPEADLDISVNLLVGGFYARYLAEGRIPADWPERMARLVWEGIAGPERPTGTA